MRILGPRENYGYNYKNFKKISKIFFKKNLIFGFSDQGIIKITILTAIIRCLGAALPPPLGGVVPHPSLWCYLPSPPSFKWGSFVPFFCWVVLLCLFILGRCFLGGTTFPSLLLGRLVSLWVVLRLALSPFAWCCLPSHPFGGAAFSPSLGGARFSPLFCWVVLSTFSSFGRGFPSPLLLGGVAWPPSLGGVALFPLYFARCCLPSPPSLSAFFCLVVLHVGLSAGRCSKKRS